MRTMWRRFSKRGAAGAAFILLALEGCMIDPDIGFRAALLAGSDLAVFLLDNLAASI